MLPPFLFPVMSAPGLVPSTLSETNNADTRIMITNPIPAGEAHALTAAQILQGNQLDSDTKPLLGQPGHPIYIKVQKEPESQFWRSVTLVQACSSIIFVVIMLVFLVSMLGGSSSGLGTGSKGHHEIVLHSPVRFSDIQGCDEVKNELIQAVEFLKNPEKFERYGAKMPRGFLLQGPPGVGKTLLAKAVAGEANVPFLVISGAEFDEVFVGVGAARVRELFGDARKHKKAVIFIDEIDAMASRRSAIDRSGNRQTLNQLLVEMDGFRKNSDIIVLAATNNIEIIDEALLRPGRFDKTLSLFMPDVKGRRSILDALVAKIPKKLLADDINLGMIASMTIGYSGADLAQLVNQAKLFAATQNNAKGVITMENLLHAKDVVEMGPKRSLTLTEPERIRTAFHEAGHAIVGLATPDSYPVQRATIVPHGNALGMVISSPDEDRRYDSRSILKARIDLALGGFLAEEKLLGKENVSTGASSDLQMANRIARHMVTAGFGTLTGFLQPLKDPNTASEAAKQNFEADVQEILKEAAARVRKLLEDKKPAWVAIAEGLLAKESLTREEMKQIYESPSKINSGLFSKRSSPNV